jgi:hypothetical protein
MTAGTGQAPQGWVPAGHGDSPGVAHARAEVLRVR